MPATPRTVNLVGLSIYQKHWQGNVNALTNLLGLCSIEVQAVLCAGSSVKALRGLRTATLNVMVHEEFGTSIAG